MSKDKEQLDHYQVLGVPVTVEPDKLRKAYKKLCQKYHPDKDEANGEHFRRIRRAYDVLSDPQRRAIYDQGIKQGISPEEFSKVLGAMSNTVVLKTFERLAQRPEGNFRRELFRTIATEKAEVSTQQGLCQASHDLVMKHIKSVIKGQEAFLVKTALRKSKELKAALLSCEVALAVLEYLLEDTNRVVCPDQDPQRYYLGVQGVVTATEMRTRGRS